MAALAKDPAAIKLFGRTISLPETQFSDSDSLDNGSNFIAKTETLELRNGTSLVLDEVVSFEQPQTSIKQPITSQAATNPKDHQQDQSDSLREPKLMKRPDKILPCPRCNSSDTKFCYFNNYNVNQPRHFCKSCQRYWTTGGTVRNVPVGAGRRRNKHLASQYRAVMASTDVGLTMVSEAFDSTNQLLTCEESSSSSSPNHEMVLKFSPESPYCDNAGASLTASSFGTRPVNNNDVSSQHQTFHYVVPPQSQITMSNVPTSNSSLSLAVPGFATPNMTYQLVPAAYMNSIPPLWLAGSGNVSLVVSNGSQLQVLGKHSRHANGALEGCTTIEEGVSAPKSSKKS